MSFAEKEASVAPSPTTVPIPAENSPPCQHTPDRSCFHSAPRRAAFVFVSYLKPCSLCSSCFSGGQADGPASSDHRLRSLRLCARPGAVSVPEQLAEVHRDLRSEGTARAGLSHPAAVYQIDLQTKQNGCAGCFQPHVMALRVYFRSSVTMFRGQEVACVSACLWIMLRLAQNDVICLNHIPHAGGRQCLLSWRHSLALIRLWALSPAPMGPFISPVHSLPLVTDQRRSELFGDTP